MPKPVVLKVRSAETPGVPKILSGCLENPRDGGAWWAAVYGVATDTTEAT